MHPDSAAAPLSRETLLRFLEYTPPFSELDAPTLTNLVERCQVEFYPEGTRLLERGKSPVTHLRVIYEGKIKLFLQDEEGETSYQDFRDRGETIGALGILRGSMAHLDVVTERDTICILIEQGDFLELIAKSTAFSRYYLKTITEVYVSKTLSQLEKPRARVNSESILYLFTAQVGDVVRGKPVTIPHDETVQKAARTMNERRVGYLLVTGPAGQVLGIVTDRDLRTKVVAAGENITTPVERVMSAPVEAVSHYTTCFDALLEMMRQRVHHLVVSKQGEIVGVVSGHDLMVLQGSSPLVLVRQISAARSFEEVYDLSLKSPRVVRSLIYEGAKAGNITRMITLINDYILDRILSLMEQKLGQPPLPFCWLLMGSEGRREQTYRTDQDNGLIYADPEDEHQAKLAEDYFRILAEETIEHLVACGFPRCHGNIMASNPDWRRPYSVWQGYFDRWIKTPEPKEVLHATIFFDFRPGWGDLELGQRLRNHLTNQVKGKDIFLRFLARDTLTTLPALSFFKNFIVEKEGPHKNKLDLKEKGMVPFVDFARVLSLQYQVPETNTLERLMILGDNGNISRDLLEKSSQAYEFQMQLRLVHQQSMHEQGLEPDNFIDPHELSYLERRTLKEAFGVVAELKSYLKDVFQLSAG
ncbi:MAG: CBS domain-containing protein [Deltaproteobacteria bacterium]|nr:CBS domain-containing protein [Deltaproteobacteria bacterium]